MIVVLDESLEEKPRMENTCEYVERRLLANAEKKGYNKSIMSDLRDRSLNPNETFFTLGLVGMLSHAYSKHLPIALGPHDFWFVANCELASIIAKNPEQFRDVFSSQEGTQTLLLPTGNPAQIDYILLAQLLDSRFPNKEISELIIPSLSTSTVKVHNAFCASMADAVQHYYDYMTFLCGIPKIKVLGTADDYRKLSENSRKLAEIMEINSAALTYYDRISGLFDRMAETFEREDGNAEFWRGIYTHKNVGSGPQLDINGWIRDFFSKRPARLENFNTSIASVPYKNITTDGEYLGFTGAFAAVRDSEGFWNSDFREAIFQKVDPKELPPKPPTIVGNSRSATEKVTYYSDGTKKVELIPEAERALPKRDKPSIGWTLTEEPIVAMGNPNIIYRDTKVSDTENDVYEAIAYAMEQIMLKEEKESNER